MDPNGRLYHTGVGTIHPLHKLTPSFTILFLLSPHHRRCVYPSFFDHESNGLENGVIQRGYSQLLFALGNAHSLRGSCAIYIVIRFEALIPDIVVCPSQNIDKLKISFHAFCHPF